MDRMKRELRAKKEAEMKAKLEAETKAKRENEQRLRAAAAAKREAERKAALEAQRRTLLQQSKKFLLIFLQSVPWLSLFSTRLICSREQRKKQLDWLATNTDDITTQSHSLFACSREKHRQVENGSVSRLVVGFVMWLVGCLVNHLDCQSVVDLFR